MLFNADLCAWNIQRRWPSLHRLLWKAMGPFIWMFCCGRERVVDDSWRFDILGRLPPEIAITILRMCDPSTLMSSALVSKTWLTYVKSDPELNSRIRLNFRRLRESTEESFDIMQAVPRLSEYLLYPD